jgi:hypothetical protein
MSFWLFLMALLPGQEGTTSDRLKRDGWKAVEELGAQAALKPELEKLSAADDPELQWWAGAALAEIDAREKGAAAYVGLRRVTLEAKERKAHEVLSDLLALENFRLVGDLAPAQKSLSVKFSQTPFFQAADEVCRDAGCILRRRPDGDFEVKNERGRAGKPTAYAGPLCFEVTNITVISTAEFRGDPEHRLVLGLAVRMDPRVVARARGCDWQFVSARDDTGADLKIRGPGGWGWSGNDQPPEVSLKPSLARPGKAARKVASIRGIAILQVGRVSQEMQFDDVLSAVDQQREAGSLKITFKSLTFADRKYSAFLQYSPTETPATPNPNDLVLEDAAGGRFMGSGGSVGGGSILMHFEPRGPAKTPARLRLTVFPDIHPRKVYFELRDIPIP